MNSAVVLFLCLIFNTSESGLSSIIRNIGSHLPFPIQDIGSRLGVLERTGDHPVREAALHIGSSGCPSVRKLLGAASRLLHGEEHPALDKLKIWLKTKDYLYIYDLADSPEIFQEQIDYDKTTAIIFHGYLSSPDKEGVGDIIDALLERGGFNVLAVDMSGLLWTEYVLATERMGAVGRKVGEMLAAMTEAGLNSSRVHLIGHSLGAHIAGETGRTYRTITGRRLARITGLDPAGPCFSHYGDDMRLSKRDAEYVDVIHTNVGVWGIKEAIGHADYYPNGGVTQPGCPSSTCDHGSASLYFADSILDPEAFPALACASWQAFDEGCAGNVSYMGFPSSDSGVFYLKTVSVDEDI